MPGDKPERTIFLQFFVEFANAYTLHESSTTLDIFPCRSYPQLMEVPAPHNTVEMSSLFSSWIFPVLAYLHFLARDAMRSSPL